MRTGKKQFISVFRVEHIAVGMFLVILWNIPVWSGKKPNLSSHGGVFI